MHARKVGALSALAVGMAFPLLGDNLALDDGGGIFSGSSCGAIAAMAYQEFHLEPMGGICLHNAEDFYDFEPVFTPYIGSVYVTHSMLDGFSLNTNGTLRLSLGFDGTASGSVSIGAAPLVWGTLSDSAYMHRCIGGIQEMCHACGRRHSTDAGYDCSHDSECQARASAESPCTCQPILLRTNWDDDNLDGCEDRLASVPSLTDDEIAMYRAVGVEKGCCCYSSLSDPVYVHGLTASGGLRPWSGTTPAESSASAFGIEAVAASSAIGGYTMSYEIRDETNGLVRSVVRHLTAANVEIRPDFDDDGTVDSYDRLLLAGGEPWQIRVREEPYLISLASEGPYNASASLLEVGASGTPPAIRTAAAGGMALLPGVATNSAAFATPNGTKELFVDASGGPGSAFLSYSLGFGEVHEPMVDTRLVRAVDANVREKWETTNSLASLVYDFSDVTGDIWWSIYDEDENVVAWGLGGTFSPGALAPGNYLVEVYFADVCDGGSPGYMSSAELHVLDVRLARLFETANEANRIFNPTRKDDTTGNPDAETETVNAGTPLEERYAAPRHYLYTVGDPVTGNFNVSAQFNATGAEGCTNYYCAFYQANGQKVPGTETNVDLTAETVAFSLPAPALATNVVWELRGGLDVNHNATLDNDEAAPFAIYTNSANVVKHAHIKGITKETYEDSSDYIDNRVDLWLYGDATPPGIIFTRARTLLKMFYLCTGNRGLAPELRPDAVNSNAVINAFANDGSCFSEWLTHNSGSEFNSNGAAAIYDYIWEEGSEMSDFIASQIPFQPNRQTVGPSGVNWLLTQTGSRLNQFYTNVVESQAMSIMSDMEIGSVQTFPTNGEWYTQTNSTNIFTSLSASWVPGITANFGANPGGPITALTSEFFANSGAANNYEAYITVGRGRIVNPRYKFEVQKQNSNDGVVYVVTNLMFGCTVMDLYDFNYEDGGAATHAAAVQLGFANGSVPLRSEHGKIFTHKMHILKNYPYPFTHQGDK